MNLIDKYVYNFIDYETDIMGCSPDTIIRYECLINVYKRFLYYQVKDDSDLVPYLNRTSYDDFFKALIYYIRNNKIKSEDSCNLFISVIKSFFRFLAAKEIISDNFVRSFDHNSPQEISFTTYYKKFMRSLKSEKTIEFSSEAAPLNQRQVIDLVKKCDKDFENYKEKARKSAEIYHKLIKIIMIKLVILTGISQRSLTELLVSNIDVHEKVITINGIGVMIPDYFCTQVKVFLEIRKLYTPQSKELFIRHDGSSIKGLMGSYLGYNNEDINIKKPGSVIGISKYAIVNMLQTGISQKFIKDFTGYKNNVIEPCQEYSDIGREEDYIKILNKSSNKLIL